MSWRICIFPTEERDLSRRCHGSQLASRMKFIPVCTSILSLILFLSLAQIFLLPFPWSLYLKPWCLIRLHLRVATTERPPTSLYPYSVAHPLPVFCLHWYFCPFFLFFHYSSVFSSSITYLSVTVMPYSVTLGWPRQTDIHFPLSLWRNTPSYHVQ